MKLYKYNGCVFNGNNQVINREWLSYTHANSKAQAMIYLGIRYKKEHKMCSYCVLKIKYLEEV